MKDKVVLVTGSSSGIGKAIAIACAKHGAKIVVHYRKNKSGAEDTLKVVKQHSDGKIYQADLSNAAKVKTLRN